MVDAATRYMSHKERFNRAFAHRVYDLMAEKNITGLELQRRSNIPAGTLRLLKDGLGTISLLAALDLASALEVSLEDLVRNCYETSK